MLVQFNSIKIHVATAASWSLWRTSCSNGQLTETSNGVRGTWKSSAKAIRPMRMVGFWPHCDSTNPQTSLFNASSILWKPHAHFRGYIFAYQSAESLSPPTWVTGSPWQSLAVPMGRALGCCAEGAPFESNRWTNLCHCI